MFSIHAPAVDLGQIPRAGGRGFLNGLLDGGRRAGEASG
jgi:hypothetical protein